MRRSLSPKTNTPRLACVKPAASVHPEPGSNSSSYIVCLNKSKLVIIVFYLRFNFKTLKSLLVILLLTFL